jgi:hypothetical protein
MSQPRTAPKDEMASRIVEMIVKPTAPATAPSEVSVMVEIMKDSATTPHIHQAT